MKERKKENDKQLYKITIIKITLFIVFENLNW
jgi:hypothetical protein